MRLWLPVIRWRRSPLSRLSTNLYYHFVRSQALFFLPPSSLFSSSFPLPFLLGSRPYPYPCIHPRAHPSTRSRPCPCSRRRFLPPGPGALFSPRSYSIGQAPGFVHGAAGYLQAPPPVYRDYTACGMAVPGLLLCFFSGVTHTRAPRLPPFAFHSRSLFRPRPRPCLRYCPRLFRRLRSRSRLAFVSSPPLPFLFPFPPPFTFPPPTPFAPSRSSDPVTPSVQCACTETVPCGRSFRVPASATPCLQR